MTVSVTVTFPTRFNGPPGSANGGYASGVIAGHIPADLVEVTLRRPPPLDEALDLVTVGDAYEVRSAVGDLIATARSVTEPIEADDVVLTIPPDAVQVLAPDDHPFRTCFTCGPDRAPDDGLRIFAKRVPGQLVADWWTPVASLAGSDGNIPPEIVWAALDCPGGWAAFDRIPGRPAVLGRMTAHVHRSPAVGEACVAVASSRWQDGRKIDAHSALYTRFGELLGAARAVWIEFAAPAT